MVSPALMIPVLMLALLFWVAEEVAFRSADADAGKAIIKFWVTTLFVAIALNSADPEAFIEPTFWPSLLYNASKF